MAAMSQNLRGAAMMIGAMAAFTINDAAMKFVLELIPLAQALFLRGALTLVPLFAYAVWRSRRAGGSLRGALGLPPPGRDRRLLNLRSLAEIGAAACFLTALQHLPLAGLTAILQSLPLLATLGAAFLLRERLGWPRMAAILAGLIGVMVILRPGGEGFGIWSLLGLASVIFVAARDLLTRSFAGSVSTVGVVLHAGVAVMVMAVLVMPFEGVVAVPPAAMAGLLVAGAGVLAGCLLIVGAMRAGEVAALAPLRYLSLLFASVLGFAVFGEVPDGWTLAGGALVVGAGLFAGYHEYRLGRRGRPSAPMAAPAAGPSAGAAASPAANPPATPAIT